MNYPSLEHYNEALQHPGLALVDPELKKGTIATTGLGLPLALCGGFALTYTVTAGGKKYALRCFHKKSNALEERYAAISRRLKSLHSPYFVDFDFQPQGVRVNGSVFPAVKMAWATGTTLGQFVAANHQNHSNLEQLTASMSSLATYLEGEHMAHGDIQPGNLMVANNGGSVQLIDYDGMFVEELKGLRSAELGQPNFQHPERTAAAWDARLDRFSFISLDLAVRALQAHPDLWAKTQSDSDSFLFKANDFANPEQSVVFNDLFARPQLSAETKNLAAICKAPFGSIPTLEDFRAGRNIPNMAISFSPAAPVTRPGYISAYPVLAATDYLLCLHHVGDRVELVGRIVEVKQGVTYNGKPYVFVNFAHWKGEGVKITIWSEGLEELTQPPDRSWVGKWLSVIGLMEPPYRSEQYGFSHLSITATQTSQLHVITEAEACFRLQAVPAARSTNSETLERIRRPVQPEVPTPPRTGAPRTPNQAVLDEIRSRQRTPSAPHPASHGQPAPPRQRVSAARPPSGTAPTSPTPAPATGSAKKDTTIRTGCLVLVAFAVLLLVWSIVQHM